MTRKSQRHLPQGSPAGAHPADTPRQRSRVRTILLCLALAAAAAASYWPLAQNDFFEFDDSVYITDNPHIKNGIAVESIAWAFTANRASNWHPLTWISHMIDVRLFGMNPAGHHLTSLAIHTANGILLFLALSRLTAAFWSAAFVSAIFLVHPLGVESVAWAAERKNVLSTFFWMLTLLAYARYAGQPSARRMFMVALCLALGLMSKPMLVTVPFVLLLLDYWPLKRLQAGSVIPILREKIPLFALAGISSLVTFLFQKGTAVALTDFVPFSVRISNALVSYLLYLRQMIWPANLAFFYPHPGYALPVWQVVGSVVALAVITYLAIESAKRMPPLFVGWLWYVGTLVPVIGLVQVGRQSMADRYTYVPLIGIYIMLAWGIPALLGAWKHKKTALAVLAAAALIPLALCTRAQVGHWKNSIAAYDHAARTTVDNYLAHHNLAVLLSQQGDLDGSMFHYSETVRIKPDNYPMAYFKLGIGYAKKGNRPEAIKNFTKVLKYDPANSMAHNNLGSAYLETGNADEAARHFAEALRLNSNYPDAHYNLGNILARKGRLDEAVTHLSEAIRLNPNFTAARQSLEQVRHAKNQAENR